MKGKPRYKEIAEEIKSAITSGVLKSGQLFPSFRELEESFCTSRNTISVVFDLLASEGYIEKSVKRPFRVASKKADISGICWNDYAADVNSINNIDRIQNYIANIHRRGVEHANNILVSSEFGFTKLYKETLKKAADKLTAMTFKRLTKGEERLREAISVHLKRLKIDTSAQNIVIVPNLLIGQYIVLMSATGGVSKILTGRKNPFYIYSIAEVPEKAAIQLSCDRYGLSLAELASKAKTCVSPILHFEPLLWPYGIKTTEERTLSIFDYCRAENIPIIETDMSFESSFDNEYNVSMKSLDSANNVLYVSGLFTELCPMDSIGFVVAPVYLAERFAELVYHLTWSNSYIAQMTALELLESNTYYQFMEGFRKTLKQRHADVEGMLAEKLNGCASCRATDGGIYRMLEFVEGVDITKFQLPLDIVNFITGNNRVSISVTSASLDKIEKFLTTLSEEIKKQI